MPFEQWIGLAISDEDLYRKYREGMTPILERYGGSFRYDLVIASVLEAEVEQPIDRVFAIEFPDRATRERFFADPEYLAVRRQYFEPSVTARVLLAELER